MKWLGLLLVLAVVGGSWFLFVKSGEKMERLGLKVEALQEAGDPEEEVPGVMSAIQALDGERTFNGILLAISSAVLMGILFAIFVLPAWVGKVTQAVYGSGEEVEASISHEARALLAKGDFEVAIGAFEKAAVLEPGNRMHWIEIAKIRRQHLDDPRGAVATLEDAMAQGEWTEDDRGVFLFRVAEIYEEDLDDRAAAAAVLDRVIRDFPESRHAMNARIRIRDMGMS